jgi:hypothetical protein
MKSTISIITFTLIVSGCSVTTYFSLEETYPEYIEKEISKVEKITGVEVKILLNNDRKQNGELLSVRDSIITLCKEYSATEEELAKLKYPIHFFHIMKYSS